MPIVELAIALRSHETVELWADDPAASEDLDSFVGATGHHLLARGAGLRLRAVLRRKGSAVTA